MNNNLPSIEDLLKKKPEVQKDDATTPAPTGLPSTSEIFNAKMTDIGLQEKERATKSIADANNVPYVNLVGFPISPEALSQIPQEQAQELKALCFLFTGPELRVAAIDPNDDKVKELAYQLQERNKTKSGIYQISEHSFETAIKLYEALPKIKTVVKGVKLTETELGHYQELVKDFPAIQKLLNEASTTDVLTIVIAAALELDSSDIHIEAEEAGVKVRLRVDGILQDVAELPPESWKKIISRIKLIAGLKINVVDRPQDGRYTIFLKDSKVDVRTSTLPTAYGESVVMRLLHSGSVQIELSSLGMREAVFQKFIKEVEKPHGMIVTTGPTGSGKTTTLYAVLQKLNTPGVKIITLEDPIEYKVTGINQSQIDHTKDYTFAKGLRSILRQDPDIVMVGEIRDLETGDIAIQAALTGHLMLSTIHTNDAAGAIPRFISMGVKPFLLAPAMNAIIGQRLVRKIHDACKEAVTLDQETLDRIKKITSEIPANSGEKPIDPATVTFYHGKGCDICNHTGYKGRIGIYELLLMTPDVEQLVLTGDVSEYQMREVALKQGMVTMVQDGLIKAAEGITTVEEVFRVSQE